MPRKLRYNAAVSLDGFIAGPDGEYDWIVQDDTIDFAALFGQFDTLLMGRRTYELVVGQGPGMGSDHRVVVCSRTLDPAAHPAVTILSERVEQAVAELKRAEGKDIWLFGGGDLLRGMLDGGLVDTLELAVVPVLLGEGVPVLAPGGRSPVLRLTGSEALPSGIVRLTYEVPSAKAS